MNITGLLFLVLTAPLIYENGQVPAFARAANGSGDSRVQSRRICELGKTAAVNRAKPSVYLSLERLDKIVRYDGQVEDAVWLRLNNNTGWAINVNTLGISYAERPQYTHLNLCRHKVIAVSEGSGERPIYFLETKNGERANLYSHVLTAGDIWIASGSSLEFPVPQSHLASNQRLGINYSYQWEWQWNTLEPTHKLGEPSHTVYLELEALPKSLR
jgi:hypothetical protein